MFDYFKTEQVNPDSDSLENNPLLNFHDWVEKATKKRGTHRTAIYRSLKLRLFYPTLKYPNERLTIAGSLHNYSNDGKHNFNCFSFSDAVDALIHLESTTGVEVSNCQLHALEMGLNIFPPTDSKVITSACIMRNRRRFANKYDQKEGNYIEAKLQRSRLKIYDKKKHSARKGFHVAKETLRIEKHWTRMKELNDSGIYTIADVLDEGFEYFVEKLIREWESIVFCDYSDIYSEDQRLQYSNANWWERQSRENYKYHQGVLKRINADNPNSLYNQVKKLIEKTGQEIANPTHINPLTILLHPPNDNLENTCSSSLG